MSDRQGECQPACRIDKKLTQFIVGHGPTSGPKHILNPNPKPYHSNIRNALRDFLKERQKIGFNVPFPRFNKTCARKANTCPHLGDFLGGRQRMSRHWDGHLNSPRVDRGENPLQSIGSSLSFRLPAVKAIGKFVKGLTHGVGECHPPVVQQRDSAHAPAKQGSCDGAS